MRTLMIDVATDSAVMSHQTPQGMRVGVVKIEVTTMADLETGLVEPAMLIYVDLATVRYGAAQYPPSLFR